MNVLHARVALRERSFLEILDLTVRFLVRNGLPFAKIAAVVVLPGWALSWWLATQVGYRWAWPVAFLVSLLAQVPFTVLASRLMFEGRVKARAVLAEALRRSFAVGVARALQVTSMMLAATFFVLPVFWLGSVFLFVSEVLVLERATVGTALRRAPRLVGPMSGEALLVVLGLFVLHVAAVVVADQAGSAFLETGLEVKVSGSLLEGGGSPLALLGLWLFVPFVAAARFLAYVNFRTQGEGWDVQTRFAALAQRSAVPEGTRGLVVTLVVAMLSVLSPSLAQGAPLDQTQAEGDVKALLAERKLTFCTHPDDPLPKRALPLCPYASQAQDCAPLVKACLANLGKGHHEEPPTPPSWLGGLAGVARLVLWGLVALVVLGLVYAIVRALGRRRGDALAREPDKVPGAHAEILVPEAPKAATPAEALLFRAEALVRAGHGEEALQTYLAAALLALDARGAVHLAHDRTNGEYVRACRDPGARVALGAIVLEVDRVQFGGLPPHPEGLQGVASRATALVRGAQATLTMVTLALVVSVAAMGCSDEGPVPYTSLGNPAGDELALQLLQRRGVHASRLATPLGTLPIPGESDTAPVVVVNTDRTTLEAETEAHLLRWVEAGGMLLLAGRPEQWPESLRVGARLVDTDEVLVEVAEDVSNAASVEDPDGGGPSPPESPASTSEEPLVDDAAAEEDEVLRLQVSAKVARRDALVIGHDEAFAVAHYAQGDEPYGVYRPRGEGGVLGLANADLLSNVGLAVPGNAAAFVALLAWIDGTGDVHRDVLFARAEDGVMPPSSPLSGMQRAGLGPFLWHALAASVVLFVAAGRRLTRPIPAPPAVRRAFAEHIEATGALYARRGVARHALAAYVRYADARLRSLMGPIPMDIPTLLAQRTGEDVTVCRRLWETGLAAGHPSSEARVRPAELLATLKSLSALVARAEGGTHASNPP